MWPANPTSSCWTPVGGWWTGQGWDYDYHGLQIWIRSCESGRKISENENCENHSTHNSRELSLKNSNLCIQYKNNREYLLF